MLGLTEVNRSVAASQRWRENRSCRHDSSSDRALDAREFRGWLSIFYLVKTQYIRRALAKCLGYLPASYAGAAFGGLPRALYCADHVHGAFTSLTLSSRWERPQFQATRTRCNAAPGSSLPVSGRVEG